MLGQLAANCHMENCTGHIDNTPFYYIMGGIGLVFLAGCVISVREAHNRKRLMERGVAATAEITKIAPRQVLKAGSVMLDLTLAVTAPDGEVFEAETGQKFPITELPHAGWTVPVRYAANNRYRLLVSGAPSPPAAEAAA